MKVIVAGSRSVKKYKYVKEAIEESGFKITRVVSGTCKGPDKFGERWAKENEKRIKRFPADWDNKGKAAGYIRNAEMADYADALIVVWDGKSRGTKHMIDLAFKKGLDIYVKGVSFKSKKNGK